MSVNKVILIGNVGKDPEVRYLESKVPVASLTLATSETYSKKTGEKVTTTEWHNIVLWRGLAEVAEKYVRKGMQLYIEGKIRNRSYDGNDGTKKYITEIIADEMKMLGRKSDSSGQDKPAYQGNDNFSQDTSSAAAQHDEQTEDLKEADDLPF